MRSSGNTAAPSRRPWGSLDREQIVAAALEITRREGLQALSIRRLASELEASRMALYSYISSKEALLELVADAIAEQDLPLPELDGADWEEQLRTLVRAVRRSLRTYPGLAELLLRHGTASPAALAVADRCLGIFRRAGMDASDAALCYTALFDVVLARAQRELAAQEDKGPERRLHAQLEGVRMAAPGSLPEFERALAQFERLQPEDVAEVELDLLIAGFQAKAAAGRRRREAAARR